MTGSLACPSHRRPAAMQRPLALWIALALSGSVHAHAQPAPADGASAAPPAAAPTLDTVQVKGVRGSVVDAIATKQAHAEISDSIVAEDIGKLPDNSVAAALQRVTGVQVARAGAEVGQVLVRGLPNVVTTLDGRNVFTTVGRDIELADVPTELLRSVDVYKTTGAQFQEGGIAGVVDVHLRRPFDFEEDSTIAGSVSALRGDQAGKTVPNGSLTLSERWDTGHGRMGVMGSVAYQRRPYQESNSIYGTYDLKPNPLDPGQRIYVPYSAGGLMARGDRERKSANLSFQWAPSERSEVYLDALYIGYGNRPQVNYWLPFPGLATAENTRSLSLRPGTAVLDGLEASDMRTLSSTQAHKNASDTYQAALGGRWNNDKVKLSTELAYTYSTADNRAFTLDVETLAPLLHLRSGRGAPATWITQADGSAYDATAPGNWTLRQYYDSWNEQKGEEWAWRGDANIALDTGPLQSLDVGLRASRRSATNRSGDTGARDNVTGTPILLGDVPGLASVTPGNMLDGARDFGTDRWASANQDFLLQRSAYLRTLMGHSATRPDADPALFFDDREDNYAAYAQLNYGFALGPVPVDGRIGVRATRLDSTLRGTQPRDGVSGPVQIDRRTDKVLPNYSANLSLRENLMLRLAGSTTITRPEFADLNPQLALYESTDSLPARGGGGNPQLRPVESRNADLSLEWYFRPGSLLSLAAFHRDIDGYIQTYAADETIDGTTYSISRPRNTGKGTLKGVEAGYTQFYDFLPGWLSGFGTQLNYTYIDAEADSPDGISQPLTNVSKNAYNVILMYEYQRFSARAAYNWRNRYAVSFNSSGDQPEQIYHGPEKWLDVALNYELSERLTVFAEATNLLGTTTYNYFGERSTFPREVASPERTYTLGLRFRL
ncbi:TonB-dependent receptor [Xanthomonas sp. NCPPB 2654]|uniref:TonB-dependent receptor n=1 Tax=unclassified Xanthomonas TaxID=2643310 RepID=UPI0021E006D9|nr:MULTISPECIES: TonB-dependent receptor [unclassified Xanthomonas]MDL5365192.1 TonB-dependent receptor [Xanthomonas sp. NCPPB 2654]UYC21610.1 TonB-dependent receptor [Xanthomonas sp. CFBP 8443]